MNLRYLVVDVFTDRPLEGNPLAVFPDGGGLDAGTMQKIARELNLSESIFVLPPTRGDCNLRVRIFTPTMEMQFAGHPTVGVSIVARQEGLVARDAERIVLEEGVGPVGVRFEHAGDKLFAWLTPPPITFGETFDRGLAAAALGLDTTRMLDAPAQHVAAGTTAFIIVPLRDRAAVDAAWVDLSGANAFAVHEPVGILVFTPAPGGAYTRMFGPLLGVAEDPATGAATGPLAAYMLRYGLAPTADGTRLISEQGVKMGRRSLLHILVHGEGGRDGFEIGGTIIRLADATMEL